VPASGGFTPASGAYPQISPTYPPANAPYSPPSPPYSPPAPPRYPAAAQRRYSPPPAPPRAPQVPLVAPRSPQPVAREVRVRRRPGFVVRTIRALVILALLVVVPVGAGIFAFAAARDQTPAEVVRNIVNWIQDRAGTDAWVQLEVTVKFTLKLLIRGHG
jgi:hypothetical protein